MGHAYNKPILPWDSEEATTIEGDREGQGVPGGLLQEAKMKPMNTQRPKGSSGTERAARSLLRRRLAGAKRIEAVLKPEAAAALIALRKRTGRTYSAIIEGLLLAEHARDVRRAG
jgi:hypothetical protein